MSQHDMNIANQGFPAFRSDLNNALAALVSTSSGATAPTTTFANQLWYDTTADRLKIRNEANSAWIEIVSINQTTGVLTTISGTVIATPTITGAATFAAGTAAAPALTTTGDTNTGIFFPAADTIAFAEGGVESMRINSSGNVGIGTSTPASKLDVNGDVRDSKGELRTVPEVSRTGATSIISSYAGKFISITTGGVTVSTSAAFSVGESVSIYNNSSSSQTITQGASVTIYQVGTANTGNRTLAQRGLCTLLCVGTDTYVITGGGVS